jgi:hypothetical protein
VITDSVIKHQLTRLSVQRNVPENPEEAEIAYRESAKNAEHAARMTGWLLHRSEFFPTPFEIYEAAGATLRQDDLPRPDKTCKACHGTGYVQAWMLLTYNFSGEGSLYTSKDVITDPEIAKRLEGQVDGKTQIIYSCAPHCSKCSYGRAIGRPAEDGNPRDKHKGLRKVEPRQPPEDEDTEVS